MATFPRTEAEVAALAQDLIRGLTAHPEDFPNPPVAPAEIQTAFDSYRAARESAVSAAAAAADTFAKKDEALQSLSDDMKAAIRYAENTTRFDDGKLRLIGWGGRKSRTSLEAPGQARALEILREGEGWILLDWKQPVDGGKVAAYKIQRRHRAGGSWAHVGTAVESEVLLTAQERGVDFEYHVMAVNKAGDGRASNIVTAVL